MDSYVIATGGGVHPESGKYPEHEKSRTGDLAQGQPANTVRIRMAADPETCIQRPGLTSIGSMNEIEAVLLDRQPLYEKASHLILDTDILGIDAICRKILELTQLGNA